MPKSRAVDREQIRTRLTPFDVNRYRADFPALTLRVHRKPLAYLDAASTSQKAKAFLARLGGIYGGMAKPNELHTLSRKMSEEFEAARAKVQRLLGAASPAEIIFVRSTTDGINLVARGFAESQLQRGDEVVITAMEHHSNIVPWQMACERTGAVLRVAPITEAGELDLDALERLLTKRTRMVAVVHASNVLGTINPIKRIAAMAHARGIPVLVDGAQAVPHLPVDVQELDCDFYTYSAHKAYGPTGLGVLYGRKAWLERLPPLEGGAEMAQEVTFGSHTVAPLPKKFEAGTGAFSEVIAYGAAVDYLEDIGMARIARYEQELLAYATAQLEAIPGVTLYGHAEQKVATISFAVGALQPMSVELLLDKDFGVAVRSGELSAMPLMKVLGVEGLVRASFAFYNTHEEVDRLVAGVKRALGR